MSKNLLFMIAIKLLLVSTLANSANVEQLVMSQVSKFKQETNAKAISVGLVVADKSYQFHFGEINQGIRPQDSTLYEIGSITKTYTGLLLAQAVNDQKITLDDDIRQYLSAEIFTVLVGKNVSFNNLAVGQKPITFRHLATHTSGLPKDLAYTAEDAINGQVIDRLSNYSKKHFFHDLAKQKLLSEPGAKYLYSNAGAKLVAYLMESLYSMSYEQLITTYVFNRSKEMQTMLLLSPKERALVVTGVDKTGKKMPLLSEYLTAEGGLKSSTMSMLKYLMFNLKLNEPMVATSQQLLAGNKSGNGRAFFWNTYEYDSQNKMLYHSGGTLGTSSWIALYPKIHSGIFIVTNIATQTTQGQLNTLSNQIMQLLFK